MASSVDLMVRSVNVNNLHKTLKQNVGSKFPSFVFATCGRGGDTQIKATQRKRLTKVLPPMV